MKFIRNLVLTGAVALASISAFAQGGRGFDEFEVPRTIVVMAPTNSSAVGGGTGITNNGVPVDMRRFNGVVKLDFPACQTNAIFAASGTAIATVQTSPDTTNWYNLYNFAIISNYTTCLTTNIAATNEIGTNYIMLPGTIVTNTPSTSFLAGYNLASLAFTNTNSAIVLTNSSWEMGFDIGVVTNRFLRVQLALSGTNWWFGGAYLTAPTMTYLPPYFP